MLGEMHANIGNDISGNQNFLYLGTRKFQKLTDLNIFCHKFNLAKKYIPKRIDPMIINIYDQTPQLFLLK